MGTKRAIVFLACSIVACSMARSVVPRGTAGAQTYGYEREQDPLVPGIKEAIGFARDDKWDDTAKPLATLAPAIAEVNARLQVDIAKIVARATEARDSRAFAYALTELAFHQVRVKLASCMSEELKDSVSARARVDRAQFYYEEILSHAVRRADEAQKKNRHEDLIELFANLKTALGSSGLFGLGDREPDLPRFKELALRFESLTREVFQDFAGGPGKDDEPSSPPETRPGEGKP